MKAKLINKEEAERRLSMDEMKRIVICKYCGRPEYYGEMRWLSGKCCCRACCRSDYEDRTGKLYTWDDLTGQVPAMEEYEQQEKEEKHEQE